MASTPPTHFTKFVEYSAKKKKNTQFQIFSFFVSDRVELCVSQNNLHMEM